MSRFNLGFLTALFISCTARGTGTASVLNKNHLNNEGDE